MKLIFFYLFVEVDISLLLKSANCYISVGRVTLILFVNMTDCRSCTKSEQQAKQHCDVTIRIITHNMFIRKAIINTFIHYSYLTSRSHGNSTKILTYISYLFQIVFILNYYWQATIVALVPLMASAATTGMDVGRDVLESIPLQ